jgi:diguanylate cyclase (GGDEF)-like protein
MERPWGSLRSAALVFLGVLLCGTPLVLIAHERDSASWRASAAETADRIGAHLDHTIRDILRQARNVVPDPPTGVSRLPRLVRAVQVIVDGAVVAEARERTESAQFVTCGEVSPSGDSGVVLYERYPRLRLAACIQLQSTSKLHSDDGLWLVVWIDTDELFRTAGLRGLASQGYDYRLLDASRGIEMPLEASRNRSWGDAVRREIALPEGRWVLELQARDPKSLHASFLAGTALVLSLSGLFGLVAYRGSSESARLRSEMARAKSKAEQLDARLMDEFERRRSAEAKLEREARYDELTRLPNRSLFIERIQNALDVQRKRSDSRSAVLLFDIVRLRRVNETMGREVGDQVLRGVARRIEGAIRPEDLVARAGADQFGVLRFNSLEIEETVRFVEGILDEIEQPFILAGTEVFVTCSVGIVMLSGTYQRGEDLLRDATLALNQARASEGRALQVFGEEMHARALRLLEIETDLRRAVERQEMVAYYQPILSLESGRIIGFETLARWRHPQRGIVSPAEFIPVAEQTGLIIQIDRWNLGDGTRQLARWQTQFPDDRPFELSANLAANEMSRPDIVDFVRAVLEETKIDPRTLAIEVTESGVMKNPETAAKILKDLHALGVHLHLDDFGTGYSSLAYLQRFSFDLLKIDRAFVGSMMKDRKSYELVKTVLALANALDMGVVAEGIETREQLAELRSMGCEKGQGFLFSRPIPADEIEKLLAQSPVW